MLWRYFILPLPTAVHGLQQQIFNTPDNAESILSILASAAANVASVTHRSILETAEAEGAKEDARGSVRVRQPSDNPSAVK